MNKKNNNLVPIIFVVAILLFGVIAYMMVGTAKDEYDNALASQVSSTSDLDTYKSQYETSKAEREKNELQIQSIKQVYQSTMNGANENLGVFGTMFEDIIKKAQYNGLLIRSIEYDMRPSSDPLYADFSTEYNVCELKFFLVGTYTQLRAFLNDTVNNFPFLISLSKLNVTAFEGNTDYILINISLTLYSKKPSMNKR